MPEDQPQPADSGEPDDTRSLLDVHVWKIQAVRDVLLVVAVLAILRLGYQMSAITVPLLVALGLAYLFEPLISLLQHRWRWRRTTAVSVILAAFIGVVVVVVVPVSLVVVGQTASFVKNAASGKYANALDKGLALLPEDTQEDVEEARRWLEDTLPWSARVFGDEDRIAVEPTPVLGPTAGGKTGGDGSKATLNADGVDSNREPAETTVAGTNEETLRRMVSEEVARQLAADRTATTDTALAAAEPTSSGATAAEPWSFGSGALGFVNAGARRLWGFALGIVELGLLVFLVPFYFFFFAVSYPRVIRFARGLVPHENRERVFDLVGAMDRAVSGFVRGRLVISGILGTVFAIGWLIVGVPYSLALGLVVGIFCAVPYLSIVGVPVAIGLLAVDQFSLPEAERYAWWGLLLWPSLVYGIGQSLDDWVLTPLIQGKATDLDPVSIVVAVLAGGSLAGVYGMLLAVPAAACVKILVREVVMPRVHDWSEGRVRDPLPGG